jgi:hypothetical protein
MMMVGDRLELLGREKAERVIARLRASWPLVGEFLRADFEFERAQRKRSSTIPASSWHAVSD